MQNYFAAELEILSSQLEEIEETHLDVLKYSVQALLILNALDVKFKAHVHNIAFDSEQEEIDYFKNYRPSLYSQLIFFSRVYNIELGSPRRSVKRLKKYLKQELQKIDLFFIDNAELIHYIRSGSTTMDQMYFLRKNRSYLSSSEDYFSYDSLQSTGYDMRVADILAKERLEEYLNEKLERIRNQETNTPVAPQYGLEWTDNKIALVELIYALHSAGSINHGKKDIKELARCFQQMFNVDLGDYYKAFLDIKMRKTGRAKYIDNLSDQLQRRIDNQDDI